MHKTIDSKNMHSDMGAGRPSSVVRNLSKTVVGILPWLVIAALLYAGFFVKPKAEGEAVRPPVIDRRDLLFGLVAPTSDVLWVVGNYGKILRSVDKGGTWIKQDSGTNLHLQDIASPDGKLAVAVGNEGILIRTEDGGKSWTQIPVPKSEVFNKLIRVKTYDKGRLWWAVGEMGMILFSNDFGESWTRMREEEDVIMNDVIALGEKNIWVVGEYGRMFHSKDGGSNWEDMDSGGQNSLMAIDFRNNQEGFIVGLSGTMLWTTDGGKSWNMVDESDNPNKEHLFAVSWDPAANSWLAVGAKGIWVRVAPDISKIWTGKLSSSDLSAHTDVSIAGDDIYVTGASIGVWNKGKWLSLAH
jgi:photosystem II stability/assembly factor-like uncharacterized protein